MKKIIIICLSMVLVLSSTFFWGCNVTENSPGGSIDTPENSKPNLPELPDTENPEDPETETPELPPIDPAPELPPINPEPEIPPVEPKPEVPAPNPIPSGDVLVKSTTISLTVRSGKGTGFSAVGSLDSGDMLQYVSEDGGWYEVIFKNKRAYVSKTYSVLVGFGKGNAAVERVVAEGKKLMGIPYVYGAERYHWGNGSLNTKFNGLSYDCSSLTQYIYKKGANVNIATTSREQSLQGTSVSKCNLKRGDLMFFTNDSRVHLTGLDRIGHVAMFLGDNYILHTASDHAVIEPISSKRWGYFINARRLV